MRHRMRRVVLGAAALTATAVLAGVSTAAGGSDQVPTKGEHEEAVTSGVRQARIVTSSDVAEPATPAGAAGEDEDGRHDDAGDRPIVGPDVDRAAAAALAHTGGGRVTETEVGDEESYYEVEVTLVGGRQVDVQLDENFNVVGTESDGPIDD